MKKYFIKVTNQHVAKNKLQEAVYNELIKHDGTLLSHTPLSNWKVEVEAKIKELNEQHPRCKPLRCDIYGTYKTNQMLHVDGVIYLSLYTVNSEK